MKWTSGQQKVIDSRGRSLLVSAAAGSGKTAVLVERIIQMISSGDAPLDLDRLLVMTFTNAAAAEMRERIGAALEEKLKEEPQNEHLWLQSALVPQAQIMTIDSFCLNLIREHYNTLEIDPGFRIGDEGELTLLRGDVMEELLEACYEEGEEAFLTLSEQFGSGRSDQALEDTILRMWQFSQSHPWPDEWLARCAEQTKRESAGELDDSPWFQFLKREICLETEELIAQMEEALEVSQEENGPLAYEPAISADIRNLKAVGQAVMQGGLKELYDSLSSVSFDRLKPIRNKDVSPEKKEFVSETRKRTKKALERLKDSYGFQTPEEAVELLAGTGEVVRELLKLSARFDEAYTRAKRERNILDFNDLEHLALQVLFEPSEDGGRKPSLTALELSRRYEEILVDEYQDSNLVQESLISVISREAQGTPNVFMVGDVKQSIYRFRLARPELFMEKYTSYTREESSHQLIELRQNFRSRPEVLSYINSVFYQIMTESLGGIDYTEDTALYPGAEFPETEERTGGFSSLMLTDTGNPVLENLDEEAADYTAKELEAKMVASRIRSLVSEEEGIHIWDKDAGGYRKAEYGDIVILLRSMSGWSEVFVNVLMNEGIPVRAQTQTGYFATVEVETILSLLSVIDNPIQDIPLTAVLRSPIVAMTDEELAWLMAQYKNQVQKPQDRGIYGAWKQWMETEAEPKEDEKEELRRSITEKLLHLERLLESFRREARYLPVHELLYHIYRESGYYDYVSSMAAGETRRANLDMLAEKAAAYQATSYKGLFHFVRYIERLKKFDTDFGEAQVTGDEKQVVRIMSIHKSKGLEFPIVFLSGMGKKFNKQDSYAPLLLEGDLGVAADYQDQSLRVKAPTLKKQVLKRKLELDSLGEELRILYVAMTRAKEALIMTATDRSLEKKLEKWKEIPKNGRRIAYTVLASAASYLDWILMSAPRNGAEHFELVQVDPGALIGEEVTRQMGRKLAREDLLSLDCEEVYDPQLREELAFLESYRYPYETDTHLSTMMSVSELKKQSQIGRSEEEIGGFGTEFEGASLVAPVSEPSSEDGSESNAQRGAIRGTAYHRVMEKLELSKISGPEQTQEGIFSLAEQGYLTREAAELVYAGKIWRLIHSPFGKRIQDAERAGRAHKEQQFMMGIPASEMGMGDSQELVLVQGIIDLYLEEEDGLVLIDYKTDYIAPEKMEQGEALLSERYRVQLDYYEKALKALTGKPVKERLIYSFSLGREFRL